MSDETELAMEMKSFQDTSILQAEICNENRNVMIAGKDYERNRRQDTTETIVTPMENQVSETPLTVYNKQGVHTEGRSDKAIKCTNAVQSEREDERLRVVGLHLMNIYEMVKLILVQNKQKIRSIVAETMTGIVLISVLWWLAYWYSYTLEDSQVAPINDHLLYNLYLIMLYMLCVVGGRAINLIGNLPPLLGMTLAGFAFSYYSRIDFDVLTECKVVELGYFSYLIGEFTTSVITIVGVLECQPFKFHRIYWSMTKLVLLPLAAEWFIIFIILSSPTERSGSIVLGLIPRAGFMWTIIHPVTLMPNLIRLKRNGYGEDSDIITLLVASSNLVEAVTIITDFCVIYLIQEVQKISLEFDLYIPDGFLQNFTQDVIFEIIFGIVCGLLLTFVQNPKRKNACKHRGTQLNEQHKVNELQLLVIRIIFLWIEGCLIALYKWYAAFPVAWALGCTVTTFVACTGWKWRDRKQKINHLTIPNSVKDDIQNQISTLANVFEFIFKILTPIIFGLFGLYLGTLYFLYYLGENEFGLFNWTCLFIAFTIRIVATTCSIIGAGFTVKEIVFINIAWIVNSNITVYLSILLHHLYAGNISGYFESTMAAGSVMSVLVKAMVGQYVIHWIGVRLLKKSNM